jgi:hypothetical protein
VPWAPILVCHGRLQEKGRTGGKIASPVLLQILGPVSGVLEAKKLLAHAVVAQPEQRVGEPVNL